MPSFKIKLMKRLLTLLLLFVTSLILTLGCSPNDSKLSNPNSTQEKILSIYNWSTYIDPEVITQFEQQFEVKVQYDTYESNDDLYAKLKPGNSGYDIIFPSDYMVTIMGKENLVEPLNLANIPNIKNIDKKFLKTPFNPNNKYSLPYLWGTMGLGYNIKKTGGEIDSWKAIFEPKYTNRVALIEESRAILGGVLIYLGYNPNTTNPEEIAKARDYILQHNETIAAFTGDSGQLLLAQGEVDITVEWSGDIFDVMQENPDLRYAIPKEGSLIWIDNVSIAKNAPNKELAEKFINFLFEPDISAKISNFVKYGTPNQTAIKMGLIDQQILNNPVIYPPPETFKKLTYIRDVGDATKLYDEAWTEIKVGVGK